MHKVLIAIGAVVGLCGLIAADWLLLSVGVVALSYGMFGGNRNAY